jgi:hypothetical protein
MYQKHKYNAATLVYLYVKKYFFPFHYFVV